jgi:hypothetical protein
MEIIFLVEGLKKYEAAVKRYQEHAIQGTLFDPKKLPKNDTQLALIED